MKHSHKTLGFSALLLSVFFLTAVLTFADEAQNGMQMHKMEMTEEMQAHHEAVKAAIEANDFEAFKKAVVGKPMAAVDTAEEFAKVVEAHKAKMAGDDSKMKALHAELGIEEKDMHGEKMPEMSAEMKAKHEAFNAAIEANDLEAFKKAAAGTKMESVDTAEEFAKVVEAHKAMKAGDMEKVKELHEAMGVKMGEKMEMRTEMNGLKTEKKEARQELKEVKGEMQELRKEMKQKFPKVKVNKEMRETVKTAVEAGNFEAFKATLPEGAEILNHVNAENFSKLKELETAKKAKDRVKVKEIENALGLSKSAKRDIKKMVK